MINIVVKWISFFADRSNGDFYKKEVKILNDFYNKIGINFDIHKYYHSIIAHNIEILEKNLKIEKITDYRQFKLEFLKLLKTKKIISIISEEKIIKVFEFNEMSLCGIPEKGFSLIKVNCSIPSLQNMIILSSLRTEYTLRHEVAHVLLNQLHDSKKPVPPFNILSTTATYENFLITNSFLPQYPNHSFQEQRMVRTAQNMCEVEK